MGESYDQKDAEGFIRILGLPSALAARGAGEVVKSDCEVGGYEIGGYAHEYVVGPLPASRLDPGFGTLAAFVRFDRRLLGHELAASGAPCPRV